MASRRSIPLRPYLPNGGVNFDAQALNLAENECKSIENLRVFPHQLQTREGSRKFAGALPTGEDILHFHRFKSPTGQEELFAFSASNIFRWDNTDTWRIATNTLLVDAAEALTAFNWSGMWFTGGLTLSSSEVYQGSGAIALLGQGLGGDIFKITSASGWDMSAFDTFAWFQKGQIVGPTTLAWGFYSDTACTSLIEEVTFTNDFISGWAEDSVTINNALGGYTSVKGIKLYKTAGSAVFLNSSIYMDYFYLKLSSGIGTVTFWHTTDFIDADEGQTVIAAGSQPANAVDSESDGGNRVLLYYDTSDETFKDLTIQLPTVEEEVDIINEPGGVTTKSFSCGSTPVVPFSFALNTANGILLRDNGSGVLFDSENNSANNGTINYTTGAVVANFGSLVMKADATYTYLATRNVKPRFVSTFNNRLMMASTYEDSEYQPWRVVWTDVADMQVTRPEGYRDLVDDDISPIQQLAYQGEYLVVYRRDSVVKMRYVGGSAIFGAYTAWQWGTICPQTVVSWNNLHIFLGHDDVYLFDGSSFRGIGTQKVRNHLFESLNRDRLLYCFAFVNEVYKEYTLCLVQPGEDYPTVAYVYNILYNTWSYYTFAAISAVGRFHILQETTIDELIGTIDEQSWNFRGGILEGNVRSVVLAKEGGGVYALDPRMAKDWVDGDNADASTAISWHVITKDWIGASLDKKDRLQRLHLEASGGTAEAGYNTEYDTDLSKFKGLQTLTLPPSPGEVQYWPDVVHENVAVKLSGSTPVVLRWIQPFTITRGRD